MFKPELKDTGWESVPEVVFSISGDNYKESDDTGLNIKNCTEKEKRISKTINDELLNLMWEPTTVKELEEKLGDVVKLTMINILGFRLEFQEKSWSRIGVGKGYSIVDAEECIYGWVHYREDKINTFRFKIDLKGEFSKC